MIKQLKELKASRPKSILRLIKQCNFLLLNKIALILHNGNLSFLTTSQDLTTATRYLYKKIHSIEHNHENSCEIISLLKDSNIHDQILENSELKKIAAASYTIEAYYYSKTINSDVRNKYIKQSISQAKRLCEVNQLDENSFIKLSYKIKKEYKSTLSDMKILRKEIKNKIHIDMIKPINISGQQLITFFSVFTSIYFCLSYLYFSTYLSSFGINTSDYFYLSDYFSASLTPFKGILISTGMAFIALLYGATNAVGMAVDEVDTGKREKPWYDYLMYAAITTMTLLSIFYYFVFGKIPRDHLMINIFLITIVVINFIPFEKYFQNSLAIKTVAFVLTVGTYYVYDSANRAVSNVLNQKSQRPISINYDGLNLSDHNLRHLVNTTDFSLYWCHSHKESIIVSKQKLLSISIPNKQL